MTAKFCNKLQTVMIAEGVWEVAVDLIYSSDVLDMYIIVPRGFVTDFASVPRLPFAYLIFGGVGHSAAVIHDWLYSPKSGKGVTRAEADEVFHEALVVCGISKWRAWMMWMGVRGMGWKFFKAK